MKYVVEKSKLKIVLLDPGMCELNFFLSIFIWRLYGTIKNNTINIIFAGEINILEHIFNHHFWNCGIKSEHIFQLAKTQTFIFSPNHIEIKRNYWLKCSKFISVASFSLRLSLKLKFNLNKKKKKNEKQRAQTEMWPFDTVRDYRVAQICLNQISKINPFLCRS